MEKTLWWKTGIIYQIYPFSFMDKNDDGIGDLNGIINRLHYLEWLGVSAIWLSPIFKSPMIDFGYDISDYQEIDPLFGSMEDFDRLLNLCHEMGIKIILDFVPNHTSDQHPWFLESLSSKINPKRNWYIWKDPSSGRRPPNNWLSIFGGSAWQWNEDSEQYYYHSFYPQQPDLNWRNPEVRMAMFDVMRFWLNKGVDGFRIDVLWHLIKDEFFRDNPVNPEYVEGESPSYNRLIPVFSTDRPEVHQIAAEMRNVVDEYNERLLIGEIYLPLNQLVKYYGNQKRQGIHLPFNFQLLLLKWRADEIYKMINEYEALLPPSTWPNWVTGNHDNSRIASRIGINQAKIAAILLFTLRGTPIVYYGEEIGMSDTIISKENIQDPIDRLFPGQGRDPVRTPMQWAPISNAGFSIVESWLPVNENYKTINVENEAQHGDSMLMFYYRLIELRREESALHSGEYIPVCQQGNSFSFLRVAKDRHFLVAVNLGEEYESLEIPAHFMVSGKIIFGTHTDAWGKRISQRINLRPNEGIIVWLLVEKDFDGYRA